MTAMYSDFAFKPLVKGHAHSWYPMVICFTVVFSFKQLEKDEIAKYGNPTFNTKVI